MSVCMKNTQKNTQSVKIKRLGEEKCVGLSHHSDQTGYMHIWACVCGYDGDDDVMIITIKHFQLSHIRCVYRMLVHCACRITQRQIPIFDIIILFEFLHAYAMSDKINLHMNRILFSNVSFSISCCRYLATKDGFVRVHSNTVAQPCTLPHEPHWIIFRR